jgi:uncharacterized FlgJ-related protein
LYAYTKCNPIIHTDIGGKESRAVMEALTSADWTAGGQFTAKQAAYYGKIVPAILDRAASWGIHFRQAVMMIGQAKGEQGGGFPDPAKQGNRLFNMQLDFATFYKYRDIAREEVKKGELKGDAVPKDMAEGPFKTDQEGVKVRLLTSPEWVPVKGPDGKPVMEGGKVKMAMQPLKSPFFVYDSLYKSVSHYLSRLEAKYNAAYLVLKNDKSTISDFSTALKDVQYGTHANYDVDLIKNYGEVLSYLTAVLKHQISVTEGIRDTVDAALKNPNTQTSPKELQEIKKNFEAEIATLKKGVADLEAAQKFFNQMAKPY